MAGQEITLPLCEVAVSFPSGDGILTYLFDPSKVIDSKLSRGMLVEVPLGKRKAKGCVLTTSLLSPSRFDLEKLSKYKLKEIHGIMDDSFSLSHKELELYTWMSNYYHYNLGKVIFDCLPKILKRPRLVDIIRGQNKIFPHEMNKEQKIAFEGLEPSLDKGFDRFYLHGVTGSGKTFIYLKLIEKVLNAGKSVLFLIPEINLTPQFMETFETYLDCPILPYHSSITASEKNSSWKFLKEAKVPALVMGVRSSIFLPIEKLGLVIVDEEHDQSFKQSDRCPYNGRDLAVVKAKISNVPILMGSATPAVENYYQFKKMDGKYFSLKERVSQSFPDIELIDSRQGERPKNFDPNDKDNIWPMVPESTAQIKLSLEKGDQVLVFVNRLGFANHIQCRACGYKFMDPNTETPLRYFKAKNMLSSAHSDYKIPMPEICPDCGNMSLLQKGFGTEKICEILTNQFPDFVVDRFDRDEIKNMEQLTEKLDSFHSGKINILVGTQMLSKGHNFKKVNLVLILGVDSLLNFPDFRSLEKAYSTITQISGRAGRYSKEAKVLIQTMNPDNNVFKYIMDHSFDGFYEDEVGIREFSGFPPFSKMALVHFSCRFQNKLIDHISAVARELKKISSEHFEDFFILGPVPAFIERRSGNYTWIFVLKSPNAKDLHRILSHFRTSYKPVSGISYKIDVDPYQYL